MRKHALCGKCGTQALVRRLQVFGVDAGFAGNGHEIGIAKPAGQDV
jgi:hypothetical protein